MNLVTFKLFLAPVRVFNAKNAIRAMEASLTPLSLLITNDVLLYSDRGSVITPLTC
jgi:hypothetical protein